ncbi:uncharacterized protein FIBRA_02192 [Fibroporia radiculosa]|uniref:Uncharacterized protein n=1 Tax=Fibroporia radiculosa TaxID=599839 RepID=J4H1Q1_9APHY|nr:uncharacterized protein FIBRA_02192 [Fibroporia radiculosa]CCM00164.1 predicted protein [Fibroporia radiculosa]
MTAYDTDSSSSEIAWKVADLGDAFDGFIELEVAEDVEVVYDETGAGKVANSEVRGMVLWPQDENEGTSAKVEHVSISIGQPAQKGEFPASALDYGVPSPVNLSHLASTIYRAHRRGADFYVQAVLSASPTRPSTTCAAFQLPDAHPSRGTPDREARSRHCQNSGNGMSTSLA